MKPGHIAKLSSRTWSFVLSLQYVKIIYTPCHRRGTNTHSPEPDLEPGSSYSLCLLGLHIMAQGMSTKFCICELLAKTGQPQISFWLFVPWLCCRCGMCAALSLCLLTGFCLQVFTRVCVCVLVNYLSAYNLERKRPKQRLLGQKQITALWINDCQLAKEF